MKETLPPTASVGCSPDSIVNMLNKNRSLSRLLQAHAVSSGKPQQGFVRLSRDGFAIRVLSNLK